MRISPGMMSTQCTALAAASQIGPSPHSARRDTATLIRSDIRFSFFLCAGAALVSWCSWDEVLRVLLPELAGVVDDPGGVAVDDAQPGCLIPSRDRADDQLVLG